MILHFLHRVCHHEPKVSYTHILLTLLHLAAGLRRLEIILSAVAETGTEIAKYHHQSRFLEPLREPVDVERSDCFGPAA